MRELHSQWKSVSVTSSSCVKDDPGLVTEDEVEKQEMASVFLPALGRLAVCGGTHGNELSGVYLVQEMERQRKEKGDGAWPIPVTTVLSNPREARASQVCFN